MDAHLDTLRDKLCQVNTRVGHITQWQAIMGGFIASLSPSPQASEDESNDGDSNADDVVDKDMDASSSSNEEMNISQWLALCH